MKNKLKKYLPICVMAVIVVAAGIFILVHGNITVDELLAYTPKNQWLAVLIILAAYALKSQTVFVLFGVIATASGIIFELPLALLVNVLGTFICITIPYCTGHSTDGAVLEKVEKKNPRIIEIYSNNSDSLFLIVLVMRSMNLPSDLLGLFFGAINVPFGTYAAASMLGMLPSVCLYTALGNELSLTSPPVLVCAGVDLLLIAAAWLFLVLRRKNKKRKDGTKRDDGQKGASQTEET